MRRFATIRVARWSHPGWWIERVQREYPDEWEAILAAGNAQAPLALRVNRRVTTREALLAESRSSGDRRACRTATRESSSILRRPVRGASRATREGAFSVQDLGAQLAAPLLQLAAGQRVLDACAAPGGKTTHIAELADVELVALDSDAARLARVRENLDRLRLASAARATSWPATPASPSRWWDGRPFDRILADVPCTASGRGPPPSRRQMAAPRSRYRELRAAAGAPPRRAVAVPRARRAPALRDVLGLRGGKRGADRGVSSRATPKRCANPSPFPPRSPSAARNSCLRSPARATIKTDFSTRCSASPDGQRPQRGFRPPRRRRPLGTAFDAPPAGMPPAIRSPPSSRAATRGGSLARLRAAACARCARARRDARRAPTRSPSSRRNCAPTRTPMCSTPSSTSRSTRRSRRRSRRACRSTSCSSSSSCARAGTGSTRRCCRLSTQYRVSYNALTRQYRVASGLLGQTFDALDEVERFLSRVTSRQVASADQLVEGHALRGGGSAAPRRQPAAEAVPGERARLARMVAAIGVASLELHAVSGLLPSRGMRWLLLVLACLGAISLFLLATASANTELFARRYDLLLVVNGVLGRAADGCRRLRSSGSCRAS